MSYQDPTLSRPLYTIQCPGCEGAGIIVTGVTDDGVNLIEETCSTCDGHGVVPDDSEPEFDKYEND